MSSDIYGNFTGCFCSEPDSMNKVQKEGSVTDRGRIIHPAHVGKCKVEGCTCEITKR